MSSPADELRFTFRLVPLTLRLLEARGVLEGERAALLRLLPEGAATAPSVTAPLSDIAEFLERAEAAGRFASLGVELAREVPRGTYAFMEFIARLAPTLEGAMTSAGRFYRLLNRGADLGFVERDGYAGVDVTVHGRRVGWSRQLNEYTLALFHRLTKELLPEWETAHVWFAHAPPSRDAIEALRAWFGVSPEFGAANCGYDGREELVEVPLPTADAPLRRLLVAQAEEALARDAPLAVLASKVRDEVRARLGKKDVGIEAVAEDLGLSPRTLQRRLADEGISFQALLDSERAQQAKAWLSQKRRSVGEIAERLGYSELRAFDRAFRRWTGQSPSDWRGVTEG